MGIRCRKFRFQHTTQQFEWIHIRSLFTIAKTSARSTFGPAIAPTKETVPNSTSSKLLATLYKQYFLEGILLTKTDGRYGPASYLAKPTFHSFTVFETIDDFVGIELLKTDIKFDKPIYILECAPLRAKMYACNVENDKITKKAKSLKKCIVKKEIECKDYVDRLKRKSRKSICSKRYHFKKTYTLQHIHEENRFK